MPHRRLRIVLQECLAHFIAHLEMRGTDGRSQPRDQLRRPCAMRARMAATVASSTPAASPRQPAWAAPTADPSAGGKQHRQAVGGAALRTRRRACWSPRHRPRVRAAASRPDRRRGCHAPAAASAARPAARPAPRRLPARSSPHRARSVIKARARTAGGAPHSPAR